MSPSTRRSSALILFVDDEPQALKYFKRAFVDDFEVLTAESADNAENILHQHGSEIAVVMSDHRMPGRSGVSLLDAVRAQHPHIVRILTTAYSGLENAIEAVNTGEVFRYIVKPWDIDLLRQELRIALQVYHLQHERNLLLAEKVSVRQRLRAADRARNLLVAAGGLKNPSSAHGAICDYVKQVTALAPPSNKPEDINLDLWAEAEAETTFMTAVVKRLSLLPHLHDGSDNQKTTLKEAWHDALSNEENKQFIGLNTFQGNMNEDLVYPKKWLDSLLSNFVSGGARWLSKDTIGISSRMAGGNEKEGIHIVMKGDLRPEAIDDLLYGASDQDNADCRAELLGSYLLAHESGGLVSCRSSGNQAKFSLHLAFKAVPKSKQENEAGLTYEMFRSLETWD